MKIYYSHHYGRMSDCDLSFCLVNAYDILPEEEKHALENGWTLGEEVREAPLWWQGRSTRLKVSEFKFNRKTRKMLRPVKGIETTFKPAKECNLEELTDVYQKYCKYRGYNIENNYVQNLLVDIDKKFTGEYRENGILRGYVICRKYHETAKSMSSVQFCWDYHKPRMFLGKYSCIKEIEFAKEAGLEWVYMGDGYQKICEYKSYLPGFQFWTGREWSEDIDFYKKLTSNDDKVKTIKDLDKLSENYLENKTFEK
tara:strand:- start:369 stop:1133 length:765 start_codon:yes stop_codon:yes gene_type:complete